MWKRDYVKKVLDNEGAMWSRYFVKEGICAVAKEI